MRRPLQLTAEYDRIRVREAREAWRQLTRNARTPDEIAYARARFARALDAFG